MKLRFLSAGFVTLTLMVSACAPSNGFHSLNNESSDSDDSSALGNFEEAHLPLQKATVNLDLSQNDAEDDSFLEQKVKDAVEDYEAMTGTTLERKPQPAAGSEYKKDKLAKNEISESGFLKPTVYYFPVFDEEKNKCPSDEKVTLRDEAGNKLITVCSKVRKACALQGSCSILDKGKVRLFNIFARISGQDRYFEIDRNGCRFGYGVKKICLDPFYTLAADLRAGYYTRGDVIYVPAVAGTVLPDGTIHDGYFIIRDTGRGIKGHGRFDFYSGFMSWYDKTNPFNVIGLADKKTSVPYYKVKGEKAKAVLARRAYPGLPPAK
ncbi:MAG: hypothetical protein J7501_01610 [Bdellovibrio sp.]|nr:hypothetical protein [Bdellovibrio sp.]